MIFEAITTPDGVIFKVEEMLNQSAHALYEMIDSAFPSARIRLACYDGYDNAVELWKARRDE